MSMILSSFVRFINPSLRSVPDGKRKICDAFPDVLDENDGIKFHSNSACVCLLSRDVLLWILS